MRTADRASSNGVRILEVVRNFGPISRIDIARKLCIGRGMVSKWVDRLTTGGFLQELRNGASRGGRPPQLLQVGNSNVRFVAVDVDAGKIDVALTDVGCTILKRRACAFGPAERSSKTIERLLREIRRIVRAAGKSTIKGIGISVPGRIDTQNGIVVRSVPLQKWRNVPLVSIVERALKVPTFLDHNVLLMALAEWRYGCGRGRDIRNMACVNLGTGVGMGLILHGRLYRGESFNLAELGHTVFDVRGPRCRCGNTGCVEAGIQSVPIMKKYGDKAAEGIDKILQRKHIKAERDLREIGRIAGVGIANVVNLLSPRLVVVSGSLLDSKGVVLGALRKSVERNALPDPFAKTEIALARLGDTCKLVGASAMIVDQTFRRLCFDLPLRSRKERTSAGG